MFHVRRTYKTKPGQARKVATLVHKQVQLIKDAGFRGDFIVYFNGGTTPSEADTVTVQWTDEALMSGMREGKNPILEALNIANTVSELIISTKIEFNELLTTSKMID
ncbi:MAG: hypothetical protein CL782_02415 [Chloroflexi bacterium]|nr:hypothetical protein [Chloroflexota bacterium]|tara:strand:+ start:677 stop:997 length:321 start_codon:yes stop_codon:yes gene_type:complete